MDHRQGMQEVVLHQTKPALNNFPAKSRCQHIRFLEVAGRAFGEQRQQGSGKSVADGVQPGFQAAYSALETFTDVSV